MAVNRVFFTAVLLSAVAVCSVLSFSPMARGCEPDCKDKPKGELTADPANCTQYYVCLGDGTASDHALSCESGSHFDEVDGGCKEGAECEPLCKPPSCHVSCNEPGDLIADSLNCNIYFMCDAALNPLGPYDCPKDRPYFNGVNCINDMNQCCERTCTPFCTENTVQIIDPKNCTSYYICLEPGIPAEANHFSCPPGYNFDIPSARCIEGAQCVILCDEHRPSTATPTGSPSIGTTSTGSPSTGCLDSFICPNTGNFPRCDSCDPSYFHCTAVGVPGVLTICPDNLMFNPIQAYPFCILPSNCPYNPIKL